MKVGQSVLFTPSGITGKIESLYMGHENSDVAYRGDRLGFHVKDITVK